MDKKGKLIALEGSDGVGKTTQKKMLIEALRAKGHKVADIKFPVYDSPTGKVVKAYLNNEFGNASELDPRLSCALYSLDRAAHKDTLLGLLEGNDYVILDRYYHSNIALQGAKENTDYETIRDFIINVEEDMVKLPKATVIWLNDNSGHGSDKRLETRTVNDSTDDASKDGHESNVSYMKRVDETYAVMADDLGFIKVDIYENDLRKSEFELSIEIEKRVS